MSRKSLKNIGKTTKATASVSRVSKRPVVVFDSGNQISVKESVLLYRVVFKTKQATLLALFFCVCFLSQPFHNVFASTEVETEAETIPEPIVLVEEVEPLVLESAAAVVETEMSEEEITSVASEVAESHTALQTESGDTPRTSVETSIETLAITPPIDDATDGSSHVSEDIDFNDEYEYQFEEFENSETITDESEEQFVQNLHIISTVESDSAYSFSKDECTRIEDGSFYCQEREQKELIDDTLIAAPDADGDLEIYLIRDGEQIQITNNKYDDASPYFDEKSKTIVWHRLINDRYQIISYDPKTGEELQMTTGDTNNMEPTRQGDMIVWQRWVNNNWEIILYDGKQELQITDSSEHDTAPHIRGPLIIWNSRTQTGDQTLKTYDIENKSFTTIADGEGVSVSNPRMVVMYEAMYENGDIIMKGFDLVTGEIIPLHAIPREMPEDIPATDSTGETRALIQSKPSVRDTVVENTGNNNGTPTATPPLPEPEPGTLDLRSASTSNDLPITETATEDIPILVIPPLDGEF